MTGDEMQRAIEFLLKNQANFETRFERFEMQAEETNRQIAQTNQVVEALAETQTVFAQTVIGYVTAQNDLNASVDKKLAELAEAQQRTQREISDLAKAVNNFINFSSGNGNTPRE